MRCIRDCRKPRATVKVHCRRATKHPSSFPRTNLTISCNPGSLTLSRVGGSPWIQTRPSSRLTSDFVGSWCYKNQLLFWNGLGIDTTSWHLCYNQNTCRTGQNKFFSPNMYIKRGLMVYLMIPWPCLGMSQTSCHISLFSDPLTYPLHQSPSLLSLPLQCSLNVPALPSLLVAFYSSPHFLVLGLLQYLLAACLASGCSLLC